MKYAKLPSISVLRSFEAAARHESYTMAAEELGVTQGAVSRQVHELENATGISLFRRVGRTVRLTKAGRSFFEEISGDLDRLQHSVNRAIASGESASLVTVAVLPAFAARWLVPRLPDFKKTHPGVELELCSHTSPFDLEANRTDLAIHFGQADWPGAHLVPLCPENLVVVASPDLIATYQLDTEAKVFDAPLLHLTSRPDLWSRYRLQQSVEGRDSFPGLRFDQFAMLISGAIAGLGVAVLPTYLIEEELKAGILVTVGSVAASPDEGYYIATPLGEANEVSRAFSNWVRRQVRSV